MTQDDVRSGRRFGRLLVEREIGSGAFGRVYLARDPLISRVVALKVLSTPAGAAPVPEDRERFLAEARVIGGFSHPNIVTLYQAHETLGGGIVLELQYVDGGTLEDLLGEEERVPVERAVLLAKEVASALGAAHRAGVVHGDVKPGNVLRTRDGHAKLADFGLARLLGVQEPARTGMGIAGTPHYMAPEVIQGEPFQPQSDVWSVGVMLHRMLSGRLPFDAADLHALFVAIQHEPAPPLGPEVPVDLAEIVARCLEKRGADRYADGGVLLEALERRAARAEVEVARPRREAALVRAVGRTSEGERLAAALDRVRGGAGTVVVATGPAGIGKSTLLLATVEEARRSGLRAVTSAVSPIEGLLRPLDRAALAASGSRGAQASPGTGIAPAAQGPSLAGVERRLAALSTVAPLLVLLEDLHHASPEEVKALVRLVRRLGEAPILWLVSERTSDLGPGGSHHVRAGPLLEVEGVSRLDVGPLAPEAVCRLLEDNAEGARVESAVLDHLVLRSGGNPFFALQWFRHLRETESVVRRGDAWDLASPEVSTAPPPALGELVSRRLRDLPENARSLLDVAAVDGLEFDGEAVSAVLSRPLLAVLRTLQSLCRVQGLVAPRERGYRFAHPLLHEVLYAEVAPELRRETHRMLAEHLESRGAGVDPERLGTHWERAGNAERAAPRLLEAAVAAGRRVEPVRTIDLFRRAGFVAGRIDPAGAHRNADALFALAASLHDQGRHDEREAVHAAIVDGASAAGDERTKRIAVVRRARMRFQTGGFEPGDEEAVREAAETLPPGVELGRARYLLGLVEKYRGNLAAARRWLEGADEVFVTCGEEGLHGSALDQLAQVADRQYEADRAEALYAEAARACERAGQFPNAAISRVNAIQLAVRRGRLEGQVERLEDAARVIAVDGLSTASAQVRLTAADVRCALGDFEGAEAAADAACAPLVAARHARGIAEGMTVKAILVAARGATGECRKAIGAAREAADRAGDPVTLAVVAAIEAAERSVVSDSVGAARAARESLARLRAADDLRGWEGGAQSLIPATVLGLPPEPIDEFLAALPASPALDSTRRLLAGAAALSRPERGQAALKDASAFLLGNGIGARRAELRIVGRLYLAEACRRGGDRAAAVREARTAKAAAAALAHVPLGEAAARWIARVEAETHDRGPSSPSTGGG